jgi:hypothetical protein
MRGERFYLAAIDSLDYVSFPSPREGKLFLGKKISLFFFVVMIGFS